MIIINKSISRRLSLSIVSLVGVLFVIAFGIFYSFSRGVVTDAAINRSNIELKSMTSEVDTRLLTIEQSINNVIFAVENSLDNKNNLEIILRKNLENNPIIMGCSLAFEPYFFNDNEQYYMPYYSRDGDYIKKDYFGSVDYDYHIMNWYVIPKLLEKPYWSEPYYDRGGAELLMTTYSHPIKDKSGKIVGIMTADLSLDWMNILVTNMKPYPNSYTIMLSRNGYYLAHNDNSLVMNQTFYTHILDLDSTRCSIETIRELGDRMIAQEEGLTTITINDEKYYAFFQPITRNGWSVLTASLRDDVLADLHETTKIIWIVLIISLILIFLMTWYVVKRITNPLKEFSKSAAVIAQGEFNAPLPQVSSSDEVSELHDAFLNMQISLSKYIEELKISTASKQHIESELAIAQQIQMGMVPKIFPPFPESKELDIYATIEPAKEVGGDLYDFFVRDNKLFFTIGDVSGKGIPASLLMAVSCSLFRSIASIEDEPTIIVQRINEAICANNDANMFITMFVAVLDIKTGVMEFCNAGHNPPFILSKQNKSVKPLQVNPNIPVGVFDTMGYQGESITINRGEIIFLYTDGLTEAENHAKELYGDDRLYKYLQKITTENKIIKISEGLNESLSKFTAGNEQSDDITMLFVSYLNNNEPTRQVLNLKNEIAELNILATFIDTIGAELEIDTSTIMTLNLALEEVVSNIILYAYPQGETGEIEIRVTKIDNSLIFKITDSGIAFNPTLHPEADITLSADERKIGGLGIFLTNKIMDDVSYSRINDKNILTISKNII
ncbi:MAG: SpoIIE family protein phosphatase [Bacteroidales bacterium]